MNEKTRVMNEEDMARVLKRLAHEILERNRGVQNTLLVGIQRRGVHLTSRLKSYLGETESIRVPSGILDITLYRDDLTLLHEQPVVHSTALPVDITKRTVILVDDVIYTGRTIRAALDALMDLGRPSSVQLCVLVDRGHRELPIHPDYVGKVTPTSQEEIVEVRVKELDGIDEVVICEREGKSR
ncbi:MAG: bifunctional pyr operon transcriptional regulator/uracil phosphoribosyltransferase PyrR [Thermovirgaceae bacterium]